MRNIFTRLLVVSLLLLVTATVSAQLASLEVGKVYRFKSARADRSLSADGTDDVHTKTTDAADTKQEWYVTKDGDYYVLRNLACGKYLKGAYSANTPWSMTDDYSDEYNKFELHTSNSTLNTLKTKSSDGYGYMHDDNNGDNGGYNIVGWLNEATDTGTHWTITKVDYTTEQITALLEKAPTTAELEGYTTALGELFSDAACVTPKLASLSAAKSNAAYSDLPTALQAMVDKVYNEKAGTIEAWAEDNADADKASAGLNWNGEYAKKFRVQMYEPYSIAGDITSWLGINAHANNDNPTGIYMPEAGTLYVMVEGTVKEGASLRIVDGGHNWRVTEATSGGYALQPGLNVINYTGTAGQLYICYNVDTYNPDGATTAEKFPHKLSEYPPLKIHIEGGAINGFYNAQGDFLAGKTYEGISYNEDLWVTITGASVDNDEDWEYMETRANLNVIPLLAHRQILLFHLNDYTHEDGGTSNGMAYYLPDKLNVPTTPYNRTKAWADYGMECDPSKGKINIMLEAWDRIMYSELATMGLVSKDEMDKMNDLYPRWKADGSPAEMYDFNESSVVDGKTYQEFCNGLDYSEYFNHHGVALGTESGYMYGGWDHCGYNITTYNGIVQNMANNAGSTWGPAHEIGHQHQAPLTLNGLTEVTNNLFSNIALWYKGMSTSRYNGNDGSLERVLNAYNTEGSDIYTNNIWALTHLYYRLWLYYHLAGNNTQFWPRLYELLRQQPMQKGYNVSGDVSTLHFYKLACQAAGEDLTEFFRAHGYFSIMDDRLVGDYSNSVYEVSQEMIDEAIAEVKEMGYEENLAIIFICDDVYTTIDGKKYAAHYQHDGTTLREIYGETSPNSDFGAVSDFINGNVSVKTTYTATLNSDATLTMSGGEGGVGFLVLNEDGEIVSFSNKSTFAISDEAAYLLATGKASVVAVDTESTTTEAEVDVTAMRFALLQELIENAIALTQNTSETRVGFYKLSAVENLQEYVTMAQEVIANGDLANLQAVYELLYNEYKAVVANEFSRVTFVPGSKYAIINKGAARIMSAADGYVTTVAAGSDYENTRANQWYLERDVAFRLKNADTNTYAQEVTDQNGIRFTVAADVVDYNITETSLGWYSLACSRVPSRYMNMNGANTNQVITWGSMGDDNSQWKFILLEADGTNTAKEELLELSKKTLALVNEVATVSYNEGSKISLQSSSSTTANYIWSNAAVSGNDVDKLLDSDKNTFFHSQWNNSTAPADGWGHHISVDLGTSSTLTSFKFKFTTRNESGLSNYPKTIEVYGSNVGGNDVANYTKLQVASGFATGAGVDNEAVVMGNGTAYRYLRFLVTDATGNNSGTNTGSDGMVFFHMSEFSIYPVTVSATVKSDYTSGVTVDAVLAAYNDAEQGKTVYNNASATLDDINAKKTALGDGTAAGSYTTLLNQYNSVLNSVLNTKKAQLLTLITNTDNLIKTVGSVEFTDVPLALTTENLYCNDPCLRDDNDYSADYVDKLTDGNHSTYLHTDWDGSNSAGSAPHYLRVDMGEGETITQFKFSYTTRDNGNNCPTTIVVEGSNDAGGNGTYTPITTLTKDANGLPVEYETFNSETITSTVPYRYIRFRVTATESGDSFFVMSEFSFTKANQPVVTMTNTSTKADEALVFDTYLATAKSQKLHEATTTVALLDAAIADQQAAYDKLDEAIKTPADLDKSGLEELVALAQPLYNKMAADGVVNVDYAPSALTNAQLTAASDALAAANEALASATSQVALNEAKATLQTAYDALLAVENANEKNTITTTDLSTLIGSVEALLERVATTGTSKGEIALQVGDANSEFYIWSNAPAGDCNGYSNKVEGLIDVNDDGSANTGTFFGTAWGAGAVAAYTHYLEVDLGVATSINKLSMDYTTRASGYENQRPTAIKILGSNNKVDYAEVTTIANGLATGACEQWAMETPLELGARYRYIRFAVATQEETGFFNMSDFNLYSISDKVLNDYYSTADADLNALLLALEVAKDALSRHYLTTAQYTAIKDKLNSVYNDVNNVIALDYTTRNGLTTLITDTETLINKVATVTEVPAVTLTEGILYCNADNKTNRSAGAADKLGVAALLDGYVSTFLHTTYGGNQQDDNEHHYIRVDMGENSEITAFKFSYTGRQANSNNAPTDMLVQACNTTDGEWVTLKTLTGLPTGTAPVSYESELIEMTEPYRYVRFMVTNTKNQSTTTYDGVSHPFFVMSEFDFVSYPIVEVKDGYTNVTAELVGDAYLEKSSATEAKNLYMNEADYTAAQEALQAAYDALNAATVANKTALNELIEATTLLKGQLYETVITSYETESVILQNTEEGTAGYLYCNAPGTTNNYTGDKLGVGALLDNDTSNFLHTTYNGDNNVDGLDHYLRVDLGDGGAAEYIQFRYTGRSGYATLTPKTAVVEAANNLNGDWTTIATLRDLSQTTNEVSTDCLGNGNAYRYWRFMVTETHDPRECDGHPYYALSAFNVYKCTNVELNEQLKYAPTIYIHTTADLDTEVENAITTATGVSENENATPADVETAVDALQDVYDKLAEALKYADVPVAITTDINSPKLYVIYSQRGDSKTDEVWTLNSAKCWQYNFATNNITIVQGYADDNLYQLWYFTYDDENERYGIVPVMTPGYGIGAKNFEEGASKISAINPNEADGYVTSWVLSLSATIPTGGVYYNFKPDGKTTFLSNYGGGSNALGFYNTEDEGSRVYFERVDVENFALKRLSKLNEVMGTLGITPAASEIVGEYTMASATMYSEAVGTATSMVEGDASTDAEYNEQFVALYQSYENLAINLPVPGALYKIRSKYVQNHYFFVNDDRAARYSNSHVGQNQVDADAVWVFEGEENGSLKLKNLQTGCFLPSLQGTGAFNLAESTDAAGAITLHPFGTGTGAVQIQAGNYYLHANDGSGAEQKLIGWYSGGIDGENPVFIEEISAADAEELISHSVTLAANTTGIETTKKYSTLCLGYPVTLPAESDVKAYIASGIDDNNVIELVPVANDGKTIPANTPVILKSDTGVALVTATFTADAVSSVDETTNLLGGSNYTTYVSCLNEQGENVSNVYMLTRKNGVMAMRWMYENYQYVDGVYSKHPNASSDEGGYVQCPANKAYLKFEETATSNLSTEYYFGFFGGTTDIDKVNTGEENPLNGTVYDLQGRKIEEVTVPGFYIVNGKKMYIGSELLK